MRRHLLAAILVLGLIAAVAGVASADPWPNWSAAANTFPGKITVAQTATGYDYTVSVDPYNSMPGWGIKAFVVYLDNVTTQQSQGWDGYNGGNTAGWTNTNGGWELNKYPGPTDTTAAFGWQTGGPSTYILSGASATFHAVSLPSGFPNWSQHFVVHAAPEGEGSTYWARLRDPDDPEETPEPASLVLLALGLGTTVGLIKRRKSS